MSRPRQACAGALLVLCVSLACRSAEPRAALGSLLVTPAWLAVRLADPELVVLQVDRDSASYRAGHIPGARFLPLDALVTSSEEDVNELPPPERLDSVLESVGVSTGSRIVIYGDPLAAARLFFTLDFLGAGGRAALLDGGLALWRAEGLPLSTESWSGPPGRLEWTLHPEIVVDAAWVRSHLGHPSVALLDARAAEDFNPHIPTASSLPWRTLLGALEPARLHDPAVLEEMFRRAGVGRQDTPVVYCRTGMQASYLYFVGRYLGWEPRLYDGSFADWSRRPAFPVEG